MRRQQDQVVYNGVIYTVYQHGDDPEHYGKDFFEVFKYKIEGGHWGVDETNLCPGQYKKQELYMEESKIEVHKDIYSVPARIFSKGLDVVYVELVPEMVFLYNPVMPLVILPDLSSTADYVLQRLIPTVRGRLTAQLTLIDDIEHLQRFYTRYNLEGNNNLRELLYDLKDKLRQHYSSIGVKPLEYKGEII